MLGLKKEINIKAELMNNIIATLCMLALPIIAIILFEKGWWMSILSAIYAITCAGYFGCDSKLVEGLKLKARRKEDLDNRIYTYLKIYLSLQLLLIIMTLFPFALMSEKLIWYINVMFGLRYDTYYEGGIIASIITIVASFFLISKISMLMYYIKNKHVLYHGVYISLFVMLFSFLYCVYKLSISNYSDYDYIFIRSQSEQEESELDDKIQYYKEQKYKNILNHSDE